MCFQSIDLGLTRGIVFVLAVLSPLMVFPRRGSGVGYLLCSLAVPLSLPRLLPSSPGSSEGPWPAWAWGKEQGELRPCLGSARGSLGAQLRVIWGLSSGLFGGLSSSSSSPGPTQGPSLEPFVEHPQHPTAEGLSRTSAGISRGSLPPERGTHSLSHPLEAPWQLLAFPAAQ